MRILWIFIIVHFCTIEIFFCFKKKLFLHKNISQLFDKKDPAIFLILRSMVIGFSHIKKEMNSLYFSMLKYTQKFESQVEIVED